MENASKALIIAGSILVSIVIITLGVMIVTNVTETINNSSNLSEQEIASYNQPFEAYLGTNKSATQVKALCDRVRNHNNANLGDSSKFIAVVDGSATEKTSVQTEGVSASAVNTIKNKIKSGKTYTITLGYDANTGLIVAVGIATTGSDKIS